MSFRWFSFCLLFVFKILMFQVVDRGTKDGYSTATVEFLKDNLPEDSELEALQVGLNTGYHCLSSFIFFKYNQISNCRVSTTKPKRPPSPGSTITTSRWRRGFSPITVSFSLNSTSSELESLRIGIWHMVNSKAFKNHTLRWLVVVWIITRKSFIPHWKGRRHLLSKSINW